MLSLYHQWPSWLSLAVMTSSVGNMSTTGYHHISPVLTTDPFQNHQAFYAWWFWNRHPHYSHQAFILDSFWNTKCGTDLRNSWDWFRNQCENWECETGEDRESHISTCSHSIPHISNISEGRGWGWRALAICEKLGMRGCGQDIDSRSNVQLI